MDVDKHQPSFFAILREKKILKISGHEEMLLK